MLVATILAVLMADALPSTSAYGISVKLNNTRLAETKNSAHVDQKASTGTLSGGKKKTPFEIEFHRYGAYWCDNSVLHLPSIRLKANTCHELPWQKEDTYSSFNYALLQATEDEKARCRVTVWEDSDCAGEKFSPKEAGNRDLMVCHETWDNPTMYFKSVSVECADDHGNYCWNNDQSKQSEEY